MAGREALSWAGAEGRAATAAPMLLADAEGGAAEGGAPALPGAPVGEEEEAGREAVDGGGAVGIGGAVAAAEDEGVDEDVVEERRKGPCGFAAAAAFMRSLVLYRWVVVVRSLGRTFTSWPREMRGSRNLEFSPGS
jgi:hypothetical protein